MQKLLINSTATRKQIIDISVIRTFSVVLIFLGVIMVENYTLKSNESEFYFPAIINSFSIALID